MRAVYAIALCFVLGACATFGGGGFDPYGIYDVVSMNGVDWAGNADMKAWYELRPDGTSTFTFDVAAMPDQEPADTEFSLGDMEDGCIPFSSTSEETGEWAGSICGDLFTVEGENAAGERTAAVMHKRR